VEAAEVGSKLTKKTFINHGAQEGSLFGVKLGDVKKLVKHLKKIRN
jgi:hypothetical protein